MASIYESLQRIEAGGEKAALATVVRTRGSIPRHEGSKMIVYADGRAEGTIGGGEMESRVVLEAIEAVASGRPRLVHYELVDPKSGDPGVCGGEMDIFVETIRPLPTVVVVGAGHVGRAVAHLAKWLGFRVVVSDDRPEFASPSHVPDADAYYAAPIAERVRQLPINDQTHIVLPTRGALLDISGLPHLLDTPAAYIGVIGSRRRWATVVKELEAQGIPRERLARVHAPMGLELNAETPEEIAVSILAEIVMLRRGGTGASMRWMEEQKEIGGQKSEVGMGTGDR